jgi:hypothetical protein
MAAFSVYIDDSGTDPGQCVAIASAMIVPAAKIPALDREWANLTSKEGFTDFHMSVCVALNKESQFAAWDDVKQARVISRVRQIGMKFGIKAYSYAVKKVDYDVLMPDELRKYAGKYHYTWVIRHVITALDMWAAATNMTTPFEYVCDWMDPKSQKEAKDEIDTVMVQGEELASKNGNAGRYINYSFRRRQDVPLLQCTDALAWTCYRHALLTHTNSPMNPIAQESWKDYVRHQGGAWLSAYTQKREQLADFVRREMEDGRTLARFKAFEEKKKAATK